MHRIVVSDVIDRHIEDVIAGGLNGFNDAVVGYADRKPLAVTVRDEITGETLGGAMGRSSLGLLFLDIFYLPVSLRGKDIGSEILREFEDEGRRRGCVAGVLMTINFQAPGFYEKAGWQRFGEVACAPPGTSRIFMTKTL